MNRRRFSFVGKVTNEEDSTWTAVKGPKEAAGMNEGCPFEALF